MTQKIEIPVAATLNTTGIEQGAKKIDKALGDVGRRKIDPVPDGAIRKVDALFQAYLKLDREMARRLKVTGQQGVGPEAVDWGPVYQNQKSRAQKLRQLQSFMQSGGADFQPPQQPRERGGGAARMAAGVAQAGLRAAGPAGGVAANALGTGMSAGFGAGLMGLVGGVAALGVGKLVGAITEKIEQAENNNIAYDRLKRTLGDVNVSFAALKSGVMRTGEALSVTYDETAGLYSQFAKAGKVGRAGVNAMPQEIGLGVGLSRAYGLDNSQGVGFLGQMRGVGVTKDVQDSRRMAILIGETIAKSDAFAKADEVLEAIGNFATSQTRSSMSAANVAGYAGMFSSMVGSGMAGMDPSGAASMLSRVNSSLAAGGAKGEASQFFTSMVGNRMGLDPLQMQVLREGGAFASKDQMFGVGSAYTRYMGQTGPTGGGNYLSETRALIEEKYAGDGEQQRLMRAQAFGNHTGLNMNQAMAMLSLQPNEMGELQKVLGNKTLSLNASGINNAAMALNGTDEDRASIRAGLLKRDDLTKDDRTTLERLGSQNPEEQKRTLAVLSAQYEQERTQGSDIRDSRAALDNIKVKVADYMVPALQDMRKALLYMAGGNGKKTPGEMMKEFEAGEKKDRINSINEQFDNKASGLKAERDKLIDQKRGLRKQLMSGSINRDEYDKQVAAIDARLEGVGGDLKAVEADRKAAIDADGRPAAAPGGNPAASGSTGSAGVSGRRSGGAATGDPGNPGTSNGAMKHFMDKGWTREQAAGIVANLNKESNLRPGAVGDGGKAYGIAQWHPDRQAEFEKKYGKSIRGSSVAEQLDFVHYEMTEGKEKAAGDRLKRAQTASEAGSIVSKYYERPLAREAEAAERGAAAEHLYRTPMPQQAVAAGAGPGRGSAEAYNQLRVTADPIIVQHQGPNGQQVRPDQTINTRVSAPSPVSGGATGSY